MVMFGNPVIEVGLVATGVFALFQVVRYKFVDFESQALLKEKQKEWKEHLKNNNTEKAGKLQDEVMDLNMKVMRSTMPMMLLSLVLLFVVYGPMHGIYTEENFPMTLSFTIPVLNYTMPSWLVFYMLIYLSLSIVLAVGKKVYKKMNKSGELNG